MFKILCILAALVAIVTFVLLNFYLVEVEAIYFIPWAVSFKIIGLRALIAMFIFLGILLVGLIYAIKKKALEWE